MNETYWKPVLPCGIVMVLTLVPCLFFWMGTGAYDADAVLAALSESEDPNASLIALERIMDLQEDFTPSSGWLNRMPIYHLRYRTAQVLSQRLDTESVNAAIRHFEQLFEQYPAYNHGWVPFLLADLYQRLDQTEKAIDAYQAVWLYNHNPLALRARYLRARLLNAQNRTVFPEDIYFYLRFVSEHPRRDAASVSHVQWSGREFVAYIQALQALEAGKQDEAVKLMITHLATHPHDPSARYVLGDFPNDSLFIQPLDLLKHAYANGGLVSGSVLLEADHSLLADIYLAPNPPLSMSLRIHYEPLQDSVPDWTCFLNQEPLRLKIESEFPYTVSGELSPASGRNLLDIRWSPPAASTHPEGTHRRLLIHSVSVQWISREPQL